MKEYKKATLEDIRRILNDDYIELEIFEEWFKRADEFFPYGLYHNLTREESRVSA